MPSARQALIIYDGLPKSAGGAHRLKKQDPLTAWESFSPFFRDCCTDAAQNCAIELYHAGAPSGGLVKTMASLFGIDRPAVDRQIDTVRDAATALFGHPRHKRIFSGAPSLHLNSWQLSHGQLTSAMEWITRQDPTPDIYGASGLVLSIESRFRLRDPRTGEALPFQGACCYGNQDLDGYGVVALGESRMLLRLATKPTCSVVLSLPFEDISTELSEYVHQIQMRLPFGMSSKHWTRWQLNRSRTGYYPQKVCLLQETVEPEHPGVGRVRA